MINAPRRHHPNCLRLRNIMSPQFWTEVRIPPNPPGKNADGNSWACHDKPPSLAINLEPHPNKSISKYSESDKHTDHETTTEQGEETETECYHNISPIETNAKYNKRTRIDSNDDFQYTDIPFTKHDSLAPFHAKPSCVHALISATGRILHPQIVTVY